MAFNATEFRANLKHGGARPNLFEVAITIPDSVDAERQVRFMVEAASAPAYTTGFVDVPYFGRDTKWFGDRTYSAWSVSVIADEDYTLRKAIEAWQDRGARGDWGTNHIEQSRGLQLYTDATVIAYGKEGEKIRELKMHNLFPVNIGPLEFSWSANNQIQRFSCDFEFDYYTEL
jgi:hypothetical protein